MKPGLCVYIMVPKPNRRSGKYKLLLAFYDLDVFKHVTLFNSENIYSIGYILNIQLHAATFRCSELSCHDTVAG